MILFDILTGTSTINNIDDMNIDADIYQVVIYEKYSHHATELPYKFSDLLKVTNKRNSSYESIEIDQNDTNIYKYEQIKNENDIDEIF